MFWDRVSQSFQLCGLVDGEGIVLCKWPAASASGDEHTHMLTCHTCMVSTAQLGTAQGLVMGRGRGMGTPVWEVFVGFYAFYCFIFCEPPRITLHKMGSYTNLIYK